MGTQMRTLAQMRNSGKDSQKEKLYEHRIRIRESWKECGETERTEGEKPKRREAQWYMRGATGCLAV